MFQNLLKLNWTEGLEAKNEVAEIRLKTRIGK